MAIARALANRPGRIVADEPTGNLDFKSAADVTTLLVGLRSDTGVTVIVATHDEEVAQARQPARPDPRWRYRVRRSR